MDELAKNPFQFGDPVEGDYFLPRPELDKTVTQFLENRIHVSLIGPRRFGKASFVLHLLEELRSRSYLCLYIDIFNITSHRDFLQQLVRAIHAQKNWKHSLQSWLQSLAQLRPKFSADFDANSGNPSLGFSFDSSSEKDSKEMIQDVLKGIEYLGDRVIFSIDEFQKISQIGDEGWLEATLRTYMQQLRNTSFLFTGSRRGIIYDMLNNHSRPLYRSCQPIEFPAFGEECTTWIIQRFSSIGISCQQAAIEA